MIPLNKPLIQAGSGLYYILCQGLFNLVNKNALRIYNNIIVEMVEYLFAHIVHLVGTSVVILHACELTNTVVGGILLLCVAQNISFQCFPV